MDVRAAQERTAPSRRQKVAEWFEVVVEDARAVSDELQQYAHASARCSTATATVAALEAEARHSAIPVDIATGDIGAT